MPAQRSPAQSSTFEYRLAQEAIKLRKQAEGLHHGIRRDELLRKADQIDCAVEVNEWLTSRPWRPDIKNSQRVEVA